jgi:predicted PurR-regulated permease PerM
MQTGIEPPRSEPRSRTAPAEPRPALKSRARRTAGGPDWILRVVFLAAVLGLGFWIVWYFAALFVYLAVGVALAYLMKPLVDRFQGIGLGRIPSILAAFVLVFGTLSLILTNLVPFVGAQLSDLSQQISFDRAAQVTAIEAGSPAEATNLQRGEFIISVDGESWQGISQVRSVLRQREPGEQVVLVVENEDGARRAVFLSVSPVPSEEEQTRTIPGAPDEHYLDAMGISLREVAISDVATFMENRLRRIMPIERGAIVGGVTTAIEQLFQGERITQTVGSVVSLFANLFYAIIVIPFVSFFFLKDGTKIRHALLGLVPNRYFEITLAIIEKVETNIGRYFHALLIQCISIATVATILLYFAGLRYSVAVGVFAGLANIIPYFGPLMGFIAGMLVGVAQTGDFSLLIPIFVAMALTQLADNIFFQPLIFSRAARAHPLVILFVVLIGAQLAGIIGMLVAIPITTAVRVAIEQVVWSVRNYRIFKSA